MAESDAAVLGEGQNSNYRSFSKQLGNIGDLLAAANQPIGKNGLSAAARKLSSHDREKEVHSTGLRAISNSKMHLQRKHLRIFLKTLHQNVLS